LVFCSQRPRPALQADGEPTGNGIETTLDLEFTVELRKAARVSGPRVELPEAVVPLFGSEQFPSMVINASEQVQNTTRKQIWI
jgi:acetamidase/formamidase